VEITIGFKEVADLAIRDTEAVLEFCGHRQNRGPKGVAGSADGIGSLLGMSALAIAATAGAVARLDVELGDHRYDGR